MVELEVSRIGKEKLEVSKIGGFISLYNDQYFCTGVGWTPRLLIELSNKTGCEAI